jgi:hypothetical protein
VLIETAKARVIEKNAFMVLKYSLLTARVRLSGCGRDCAADRRFEFQKRSQLFIRSHNETLSASQDRARIVFDCRITDDPAMMPGQTEHQ